MRRVVSDTVSFLHAFLPTPAETDKALAPSLYIHTIV